jgi:hypothetical protein
MTAIAVAIEWSACTTGRRVARIGQKDHCCAKYQRKLDGAVL